MSGMSSILHILLYREAPSHHEPNERGNRRSGRYHPEKLFPSKSARCERIPGRPGWMPSMLLISLMRLTPPFWMPAMHAGSSKQRDPIGTVAIPRLSARDDSPTPDSDTPRASDRTPAGSDGRSTTGC